MKKCLTIFILFIPLFSDAQSLDFLQKTEGIEWMIETEIEYFLENAEKVNFDDKTTRSGLSEVYYQTDLIKIDVLSQCLGGNPPKFLTDYLLEEAKVGNLEVFDLKENTKEINRKYFQVVDTVVNYNPFNLEKQTQFVKMDMFPFINSFKIKQLWFYNKKTKKIRNKVIGLIPVLWRENTKGKIWQEEKFQIKFNQNEFQKEMPSINKEELIWIKITSDRVNLLDSKVIKGSPKSSLKKLLWDMPFQEKVKTYSVENSFYCSAELSLNDLNLRTSEAVDTIITFDPETYAKNITIAKTPQTTYKDVIGHKINQIWFYNSSTKSLNSYLVEIAPLIDKQIKYEVKIYFDFDTKLNYVPLYYLRF